MAISDFLSSPMGLASLGMAQGMSPGDAILQGQKQVAFQQDQMRKQQQRERMAQVEQALPQLIAQVDPADPTGSLGKLIQGGIPLDVAQQVIGIAQKQAQQESLNQQRSTMQELIGRAMSGELSESDAAAGYILSESEDPMAAGFGKMMIEDVKQKREIEKEERKVERDIEKELRSPQEAQSKSYGFAQRMVNADSIIGEIGDEILTHAGQAARENVPIFGNYLISEDYQAARQAQEDWVTANLRKESGAVIGPEEMQKEIEKYFPLPGDGKKVIEQKRKSRSIAQEAMIKAAGSLGRDVKVGEVAPKPTGQIKFLGFE